VIKRAMPGDTPCTGVWPVTGKACRNLPCGGQDTCEAHDPAGDRRTPPPPEEFRCTATNRENGERCRRMHTPGGKACSKHGGNGANARKGAQQRLAEAELTRLATSLVGTPVGNPLTELSKLAGRARAWMEMLEERVQTLLDEDPEPGEGDDGKKDCGIRYRGGAGEQTRAEVQLYERAMGQLGTILTAIARLNIDERLAKITERQAEVVIAALEAGLSAAGVRDPAQRTAAKEAASRELRLVR
jgi:hypothetical protein